MQHYRFILALATLTIFHSYVSIIRASETINKTQWQSKLVDDPVEAAKIANSALRKLHEETAAEDHVEIEHNTERLSVWLRRLHDLDDKISKNLGHGLGDEVRIINAEQYRASAWLHAWSIFSKVSVIACNNHKDTKIRRALFGLKYHRELMQLNEQRGSSPFQLLLIIYKQMADANDRFRNQLSKSQIYWAENKSRSERYRIWYQWIKKNKNEPVKARLYDETGLRDRLGPAWESANEKPTTRNYSIPDNSELLGKYQDEAPDITAQKSSAIVISLWALINLQLDTWHGSKTEDLTTQDLLPLGEWLNKLAENLEPLSFDPSQQIFRSAEKMHKYFRFRHYCADVNYLKLLVQALKDSRVNNKPARGVVIENNGIKLSLADLIDSATPLQNEGGALPQAQILLRYILLLSYQNEGAVVIAGNRNVNPGIGNSIDDFWLTCKLDKSLPFELGEPINESGKYLRWNHWPKVGHFMRSMEDATMATYRYAKLQAGILDLENYKYRLVTDPDRTSKENNASDSERRLQYIKLLENNARDINAFESKYLKPHFYKQIPDLYNDSKIWKGTSESYQLIMNKLLHKSPDAAERAKLLMSLDKARLSPDAYLSTEDSLWNKTGVPEERNRISTDLRLIYSQVNSAGLIQELMLEANTSDDPVVIAESLQGMSGMTGFSKWNISGLPNRSFKEYSNQVENAVKRLTDNLNYNKTKSDLLSRFKHQQEEVEILELEFTAAQIAEEIAKVGNDIADKYRRIADLEIEINKLDQEISNLITASLDNDLEASTLRLRIANEARDLAAAQVAALEGAIEQVEQMVEHAARHLRSMQPRILELADEIEESKKGGFLSIVKSIVKVVGAALGPFTAGVSTTIANTATAAINVYEKADKIDFGSALSAVEGLADVAEDVGNFGDLAFGELKIAGKSGRNDWRDVKTWIKDRKTNVNRLSTNAKNMLNNFKNITQSEIGQLTSALFSDLPIKLSGDKVRLDLNQKGIEIKDEKLKQIWSDILDEGGMLVANGKSEVLARLPFLDQTDPEYNNLLKGAVDELVQTCPDNLLSQLNLNLDKTRATIANKKNELINFIKNSDNDQKKILQNVLGNWVIIKEEEDTGFRIIAVERSVKNEAKELRKRVGALTEKVLNDKLKEFANKIRNKNDDLDRAVNKAKTGKDEKKLRSIANQQIPQLLEEIGSDLSIIQSEIELARGELRDAQTRVKIASAERSSIQKQFEASKLRVKKSKLEGEKALLGKTVATLEIRQSELGIQKALFQMQAARRKVEKSQSELRRLYNICLRWGVNPLENVSNDYTPLSLIAVLEVNPKGEFNDQFVSQWCIDQMAEGLFGMLQWVRMLNLKTNADAKSTDHYILSEYNQLLNLLNSRNINGDIKTTEALIKIKRKLIQNVNKVNLNEDRLKVFGKREVKPNDIVWYIEDIPEEYTLQLRRVGVVDFNDKVIGLFRYRFANDNMPFRDKDITVKPQIPATKDAAHLFIVNKAAVTLRKKTSESKVQLQNLFFVVIPPENSMVNPKLPISTSFSHKNSLYANSSLPQVNSDLTENIYKKQIQDDLGLWSDFQFTGGYGDWMVFLVDTAIPEKNTNQWKREKLKIVEQWKNAKPHFTLLIPDYQVPNIAANN